MKRRDMFWLGVILALLAILRWPHIQSNVKIPSITLEEPSAASVRATEAIVRQPAIQTAVPQPKPTAIPQPIEQVVPTAIPVIPTTVPVVPTAMPQPTAIPTVVVYTQAQVNNGIVSDYKPPIVDVPEPTVQPKPVVIDGETISKPIATAMPIAPIVAPGIVPVMPNVKLSPGA